MDSRYSKRRRWRRIASNARDWLFLKKVWKFYSFPYNFSQDERERFREKFRTDRQTQQKLADTLVLILDRLDNFEKAEMLAKMFEALVKGKISQETFRRLASAIDLAFIEDLKALAKMPSQPSGFIEPYLANLLRAGLSELTNKTPVDQGVVNASNKPSESKPKKKRLHPTRAQRRAEATRLLQKWGLRIRN